MSEENRIINKVRKLLRLANDAGATEGERDNALRMAHGLLAKHNLDMQQVSDAELAATDPRERQAVDGNVAPFARQIAHAVARLYFCRYYYTNNRGRTRGTHNYIGKRSNVEVARTVADWLIDAVRSEATRYARVNGGGRTASTSFMYGAAARIGIRCKELRESRDKSQQSEPGTAVVLANLYRVENVANDAFLRSEGTRLHARPVSRYYGDASAAEAGRTYGNGVALGSVIGSRSRNAGLIE